MNTRNTTDPDATPGRPSPDPQDMTVSISHMPADIDEDTGLADTGKGVAYWLTMSIPADRACLDLSQGRLTVETRLTAAQLSRIGGFITDEAGKENDYLAGYAALAADDPGLHDFATHNITTPPRPAEYVPTAPRDADAIISVRPVAVYDTKDGRAHDIRYAITIRDNNTTANHHLETRSDELRDEVYWLTPNQIGDIARLLARAEWHADALAMTREPGRLDHALDEFEAAHTIRVRPQDTPEE